LISRKKYLAEKVVFVDGLPGCGKTLFSPIVAAMDRVELLTYANEIEHYCALHHLGELSTEATQAQVRIMTDLYLYETMMGRRVNFRFQDLSSAFQNHSPQRYFKRLFDVGDSAILKVIERDKPILNLTTHQLLAFSEPIWQALGDRCVFVEIVRHPLYMVRQQFLNVKNLYGTVSSFTLYCLHNECEIPFFAKSWGDDYLKYEGIDNVICYIDNLTRYTNQVRNELIGKYDATIITIPFEQFVLDPFPWVEKIAESLETDVTDITNNIMKQQNVPRSKIAQGIDIPVYRRCGWAPPKDGSTERDELDVRREEVIQQASSEMVPLLDKLSSSYESEFWCP